MAQVNSQVIDQVVEATEEKKVIMSKDEIITTVMENCVLEDGSLDYDKLAEIVKALQDVKTANKKAHEEKVKENKKVIASNNAGIATRYLKTLKEGDIVEYKMADGNSYFGTLVKFSDKTVTVDLGAGHEDKKGKTTRHPKLEKVCVPSDFIEALKAELENAPEKVSA